MLFGVFDDSSSSSSSSSEEDKSLSKEKVRDISKSLSPKKYNKQLLKEKEI